jgi:CBS domain-containing protein
MLINLVLVVFNLLPAFPMDGGRVLRALLATRTNHAKATQIAGRVGQAMGILFVVAGFFLNWFLIIIGLFVYLGAKQETRFAHVKSLLRGFPVRDAMMTRFRALDAEDSLASAVDEILAGDQLHFPVVANGRLRGVVSTDDIVSALSGGSPDDRIGDLRLGESIPVGEWDRLESTFERMQSSESRAVPVVRDGNLVGLVTMENVGEWLMIRSALRGGDIPMRVRLGTSAA